MDVREELALERDKIEDSMRKDRPTRRFFRGRKVLLTNPLNMIVLCQYHMKATYPPRRFESEYDRVMRKPQFAPWMIVPAVAALLIFVSVVVVPVGKLAWTEFSKTINPPVLTFNPYDQVVKVTEADGKVLTMDSGSHFAQRVSEIKKDGRYEKDYTGRLDGRP